MTFAIKRGRVSSAIRIVSFFVCSKPKESFPDCQNVFGLGNISLMVTRHMHAIYLDIVCLSLLSKFSTFLCLEREKTTLSLRLPLLSLSIMSKSALISSSWAPSLVPGATKSHSLPLTCINQRIL